MPRVVVTAPRALRATASGPQLGRWCRPAITAELPAVTAVSQPWPAAAPRSSARGGAVGGGGIGGSCGERARSGCLSWTPSSPIGLVGGSLGQWTRPIRSR